MTNVRVLSGGKQIRLEGEVHELVDFILHENYNNETNENDIALVKVVEKNNYFLRST